MNYRVSIVGAGPAGLALAADLRSHGINVLLYAHPAHSRHAEHIVRQGCLRFSGLFEGSVSLHCTFDMAEAVSFSKIIILTVPSTGQETILREFKRFNLRRHTVVAIPGNLFSLIADSANVKIGCVLETNLSPYSSRMTDDGNLLILGKKRLVCIAAPRNNLDPAFRQEIESIFSMVGLKWCSNIVESCLTNVNGVFHPLMMLMNAGRIEDTAGDFLLYHDGLTPSVARAMVALDNVRINVGKVFGFGLQTAVQISNECYGHDFIDFTDLAQNSRPHRSLKAPSDIHNRNISEDVPDVLVIWHALAERLGIDASPIEAVIVLAGMATGADYMRGGRNLVRLGLDGLSGTDMIARFGAS